MNCRNIINVWCSLFLILMSSLLLIMELCIYNIFVSVSRINLNIYWILNNMIFILINVTMNHILFKMGIYNMIQYHFSFWIYGIGLGFYIIPFVVYGYRVIIYTLFSNYTFTIHSAHIYKLTVIYSISTGTNYNDDSLVIIKDTNIIMTLIRGFYQFVNWGYHMIYYGVRMWLVFVLHSFSLGSFAQLMVVHNVVLHLTFSFLGFLLFLIVFCYLAIQIYVYIEFATSFLDTTILILFPSFSYFPCNISTSISSLLFIPVSLLDLIHIHMISFILLVYFLVFLSSIFLTPLCLVLSYFYFTSLLLSFRTPLSSYSFLA